MADWRKLFAPTTNHSLDFFPPEFVDGVPTVSPPIEVFEEGTESWKFAVVAQFLDTPPSFTIILRTLKKLWDKKDIFTLNSAGYNTYLINFESDAVCSWIIDNGPWHVLDVPMIIKRWEPNLSRINFEPSKLPLWFHLHQIPLELYNQKGISYLASAIGQPLYMDNVTASRKRLAYARVCIEADAAIEPPEIINIRTKDGNFTSIGVSIPWKPKICHDCVAFGHNEMNCPKKGKKKAKEDNPGNSKENDKAVVVTHVVVTPIAPVVTDTANKEPESVEHAVNEKNSPVKIDCEIANADGISNPTGTPKSSGKSQLNSFSASKGSGSSHTACSPKIGSSSSGKTQSSLRKAITSSSNKFLELSANPYMEIEDNEDSGTEREANRLKR